MSWNSDDTSIPKPTITTMNPYDVIIIGSGPAGYTAAIYTSRAKLTTLIISGILPGGQLMTTTDVENYPGFPSGVVGPELMMDMRKQAERFGAIIIDDEVTHVDFRHGRPFKIITSAEAYESKSVIIATGASPRKLGNKSEQQYTGRGVSYCGTCDAPFFKGENVVVVGGGDTALEEAIFLTKFAKSVKVVHRRDQLRASKIMQEKAFGNNKIEFLWNSVVTDILGDGNKVNAVVIKNLINGNEQKLAAGGLFVAMGHEPNTSIFKGQIELDDKGYIVLKDHILTTSVEGVFAAGDVHDYRYRQAITAAGFGCMAALETERWLSSSSLFASPVTDSKVMKTVSYAK